MFSGHSRTVYISPHKRELIGRFPPFSWTFIPKPAPFVCELVTKSDQFFCFRITANGWFSTMIPGAQWLKSFPYASSSKGKRDCRTFLSLIRDPSSMSHDLWDQNKAAMHLGHQNIASPYRSVWASGTLQLSTT